MKYLICHFCILYRFNLNPNVNLEELINHLPDQVTGADLYGMCHNAWLNSAKRIIQQRIGKLYFVYCTMAQKNEKLFN